MYRKKNREIQVEEVKIILEKLVPENHFGMLKMILRLEKQKFGRLKAQSENSTNV